MDALESITERVGKLRKIKANPLLTVLAQTSEMRRDYHKEAELRVEADREDVKICGVFGSQTVALTSMSATRR